VEGWQIPPWGDYVGRCQRIFPTCRNMMANDQGICILISTHDGYRALAEFTAAQINLCWRIHLPIFFCGLSGNAIGTKCRLRVRRHRADWIGIASDTFMDGSNRERLFLSPWNGHSMCLAISSLGRSLVRLSRRSCASIHL
jgi:hypothetical protein